MGRWCACRSWLVQAIAARHMRSRTHEWRHSANWNLRNQISEYLSPSNSAICHCIHWPVEVVWIVCCDGIYWDFIRTNADAKSTNFANSLTSIYQIMLTTDLDLDDYSAPVRHHVVEYTTCAQYVCGTFICVLFIRLVVHDVLDPICCLPKS